MGSYYRPPLEYSYYRILEIQEHESNTATLTLLQEDDPMTTKRSFHLSGEQNIQSIKEGLQNEGEEEVYCVVAKVMGIEVLGNIQCLPKDPQIFKLPPEMVVKLSTYLRTKDLLSLRLVFSIFANSFFPIHELFHIWHLDIFYGEITLRNIRTNRRRHRSCRRPCISSANPDLLRTTKKLSIDTYYPQLYPTEWELLLNSCTNVEDFTLCNNLNDRVDEGEDLTDTIRDISTQIVLRNKDTLKIFEVDSFIPYTFDPSILSPCKNLETIKIYHHMAITNFESLLLFKDKLRRLTIRGLTDPLTRDQVLWIAENFKELERLELPIVHGCTRDIEQEVDGQVLLNILKKDCLPKLKLLWVKFLDCDGECGKARSIVNVVVPGEGIRFNVGEVEEEYEDEEYEDEEYDEEDDEMNNMNG